MRFTLFFCLCLFAFLAGCSQQDEATLSTNAATLFDSAQQDIEAGRDETAMLKILDVIDINQQRLELAEQAGKDELFDEIAREQLEIVEMTLAQCVFTAQFDDAMRLAEMQQSLTRKLRGEKHWTCVDAANQTSRLKQLQTLNDAELQSYFETMDSLTTAEEMVASDQAARARALLEKSITSCKRILGADYDGLARHLYMLGVACEMLADFEHAEKHLLKSLEICRECYPQEHPETASTLNGLGRLYAAMADYEKAMTYLEECVEISRKAEGALSPATAWALNDLGNVHAETGDYHAARAVLEKSLEIRRQILGPENPETATSQADLAAILAQMGDYQKAEELTHKALSTRKKTRGESHGDTLNSMLNLSTLYIDTAKYDDAEQLLLTRLKICRKHYPPKHPAIAECHTNLGILNERRGDLATAEPYYQQALLLNQKTSGEQHPGTNAARLNLAGLYSVMGDTVKAEAMLRICLKHCLETYGEDHASTALVLSNLSGVVASNGEISEAEVLAERSLKTYQRVPGKRHIDSTSAMYNLARIYAMQGKYAESTETLKQVVVLTRKELGDKHPETAKALTALAYAQLLGGNFDSVEAPLEKGAVITRQVFGDQHEDMASYWGTRASLEWARGNVRKASGHFAKADAIYRRLAMEAALVQSERQQLKMAQQSTELFHLHLSMVLSTRNHDEANSLFEQSLRWKGGVLMRQRQMRRAATIPEAAATIKKLQTLTMKLATLSRIPPQDEKARATWNQQALQLTEEKERLERKLSQQTSAARDTTQQVTADALLNALPADTVLVSYLEYHKTTLKSVDGKTTASDDGPHLMAFVARSGKPVHMVHLAASDKPGAAIDTWRKGFGNTAEAKAAGRELRRLLWEPLEKHLADATTLLVSPDGPLGRIPLGVLPGRTENTYLLEDHRLAYVAVPQLLPELLQHKPSRSSGLFTMGDVNYDASAVRSGPLPGEAAVLAAAPADRSGTTWQSLQGAAAEVKAIRSYHDEVFGNAKEGNVASLAGSNATEQQFRKQAPTYRNLHIATHGFFADPKLAGAVSRGSGRGPNAALGNEGFRGYNPGLLSGLVFAGANQKPEQGKDDGILTAQEIAFIPLDDVDLVTLSACETGLGQVAGGEGLLGVQRAFQVAGARSTLASLWKVPDQATRALMLRIYRNLWERKMSKLDAVRDAQLYMLKNPGAVGEITRGDIRLGAPQPQDTPGRLPPWYWAAFILSGDWR